MKILIIITKKGRIKKIALREIRIMGRGAKGVRAITLNEGDEVVGIEVIEEK